MKLIKISAAEVEEFLSKEPKIVAMSTTGNYPLVTCNYSAAINLKKVVE